MASFTCTFLTLFFISVALQEGCGLPLWDQTAVAPAAQAEPAGHIRSKRCSCSNWEDQECIYFCHLDIIWVNTPSKILPFGLGSRPSRRRRSAERCRCLDPADGACSRFCGASSERPKRALGSAGTVSRNLLEALRTVVKQRLLSRTSR